MSRISVLEQAAEIDADEGEHDLLIDRESMTVEVGTYTSETPQLRNPHTEDEIYYIISGIGKIRVGDEVHAVESGDLVFVEQGTEHDFFDISEPITVLIVLAGGDEAPTTYSIREETEETVSDP